MYVNHIDHVIDIDFIFFLKFAMQRLLSKHAEETGHDIQERDIKFFKHSTTEPVHLPVLQNALQFNEASYKQFINGVAELANSFLKPNVRRNWFRMDLVMVPIAHFQHLLFLLGLNKTFMAKEACHPSPIKQESSIGLIYNIFYASVVILTTWDIS